MLEFDARPLLVVLAVVVTASLLYFIRLYLRR